MGQDRGDELGSAAEVLLDTQRELDLPAPERAVIPFFDRPYRTIDRVVQEGLLAEIADPDVVRLPPMVGSIEQWSADHDE